MHEEIGTAPAFRYLYGAVNAAEGPGPAEARSNPAPAKEGHADGLRAKGVGPSLQAHWDWKAAGNFMCGGAGVGLLVFVAIASVGHASAFLLGWVALAIIALGLFLVWLKIGRPWRFVHVLRQPQRSWMAREAWVAGVLFPIGALGAWLESPAWMTAAAVLGLLFLWSQAMILREAKGIPVWRQPQVVPLIVSTGLAEGGGLFMIAVALVTSLASTAEFASIATALLTALRSLSWRSYMTALAATGAPKRSMEVLSAFRPWFLLLGLAGPLGLVILGFVVPQSAPVFFAAAGACIAASGAAFKFILVTRAGFNQGFSLSHTPVRGSGVAGPAVKPGWVLPQATA
jgi:phenylacetyl-CoA:acceptor oxidoreductase subunit 2